LLCQAYPYWTVTDSARIAYQIARLGFVSMRSFQSAHDLKSDGFIGGPRQKRAEAEFLRRFHSQMEVWE